MVLKLRGFNTFATADEESDAYFNTQNDLKAILASMKEVPELVHGQQLWQRPSGMQRLFSMSPYGRRHVWSQSKWRGLGLAL